MIVIYRDKKYTGNQTKRLHRFRYLEVLIVKMFLTEFVKTYQIFIALKLYKTTEKLPISKTI